MKPTRSPLAILIAWSVLLGNAHAEGRYLFNGVGSLSCGKYLEATRTGPQSAKDLYQQWTAGFLAGYSVANWHGQQIKLAADLETYTAWLDKWCGDDPTSTVLDGVVKLVEKLQSKQ